MIAMCDKNLAWQTMVVSHAFCQTLTLCDLRLWALRECNLRSTIDYAFGRLLQPLPFSFANRGGAHQPQFMRHNDARCKRIPKLESAIELYNQPRLVWTYIVHLIWYGDAVACPPVSSPGWLLFNSSWVALINWPFPDKSTKYTKYPTSTLSTQ